MIKSYAAFSSECMKQGFPRKTYVFHVPSPIEYSPQSQKPFTESLVVKWSCDRECPVAIKDDRVECIFSHFVHEVLVNQGVSPNVMPVARRSDRNFSDEKL